MVAGKLDDFRAKLFAVQFNSFVATCHIRLSVGQWGRLKDDWDRAGSTSALRVLALGDLGRCAPRASDCKVLFGASARICKRSFRRKLSICSASLPPICLCQDLCLMTCSGSCQGKNWKIALA